jgi:hypothetical protein
MPKIPERDFTLKGFQKVLKGKHFQFLIKFGPDFKRGIDRGLKTKVFDI